MHTADEGAPLQAKPPARVIRDASEVTTAWLQQVLGHEVGQAVLGFDIGAAHGAWSRQWALSVHLADGHRCALRLKVCLGDTFGRSEVDYYTRDYPGLPGQPPLVRCLDAQHDPAVGYHLLLEDLAATHHDRRDVQPTLAHGLALAESLARLHARHWCTQPAPAASTLDRYFDEIRPGVAPLEAATGQPLARWFSAHEQAMRQRWARPEGMTLLHGDLNPTNVLTPLGAEEPVYFLDRQPFAWSLTYGLAVYDLAYSIIPWWAEAVTQACAPALLRRWHQALDRSDYGWHEAQADWALAVAQCLHVPIEWCAQPEPMQRMRWLWQLQFARVQAALAQPLGG